MSRVNSRSNNFVEGTITNITKDNNLKRFNIVFNVAIENSSSIIHRNSIVLRNAFTLVKNLYVKFLNFRNNNNVLQSHVNLALIVESSESSTVNGVEIITLNCTWEPLDYDSIAENFSFNNQYSTEPNLENILLFSKVGAPRHTGGSGIISSSLKKLSNLNSFDMGTLPASKITTGRTLQSLNDPYIEKNLIEFVEKSNVNTTIGLPIKNTSEPGGFYVTTNESLLNLNSDLQINSNQYLSQYDLKNSKIAGSELNFDGQITSTRKITKNNLDSIISKNTFQENLEPFNESRYYFEEESERSSFYTDTIDTDIKDYNLANKNKLK